MIAAIITVALVLAGIVAALTALGYSLARAKEDKAQAERAREVITLSADGLRVRLSKEEKDHANTKQALAAIKVRLALAKRKHRDSAPTLELLDDLFGGVPTDDEDGLRADVPAEPRVVVPDSGGSAAGIIDGDLK